MRAVFDCMVLIQALLRESSPAGMCLQIVSDRTIELATSTETMSELEDVLSRTRFRSKFKTLTDERIQAYIDEIRRISTHISVVGDFYKLLRDPKDSPYINLAVTSKAQFLVTRDWDMLELMTYGDEESKNFRS